MSETFDNTTSTGADHRFNEAIAAAGVRDECPRCGATVWHVLEGDYAFIKVTTDPTHVGNSGIPCAVAICKQCGFVAMHAVGALDALSATASSNE